MNENTENQKVKENTENIKIKKKKKNLDEKIEELQKKLKIAEEQRRKATERKKSNFWRRIKSLFSEAEIEELLNDSGKLEILKNEIANILKKIFKTEKRNEEDLDEK